MIPSRNASSDNVGTSGFSESPCDERRGVEQRPAALRYSAQAAETPQLPERPPGRKGAALHARGAQATAADVVGYSGKRAASSRTSARTASSAAPSSGAASTRSI